MHGWSWLRSPEQNKPQLPSSQNQHVVASQDALMRKPITDCSRDLKHVEEEGPAAQKPAWSDCLA